ncbi:hypothetical protein ABBQ38_011917 [Trebouxia sp. C0009 RCD-2024]
MQTPAKTATEDQEALADDLFATYEAVGLLGTLLLLHPLSQWPESAAGGPTTEDHALDTEDGSSEQHGTAASTSTQPQASDELEIWPTPEPNEWRDIELVATRACASLDWALSFTALPDTSVEILHSLEERLCQLLEVLLIGHLQDLGLDVHAVLKAALKPVLSVPLAGRKEYTSLAIGMFARMAIDCGPIPQSVADAAPQTIAIFCELHKPSCT